MTKTPKLPLAKLPLEGVTVIEMCQALAGPYACMLLADMGARVIKIEKPGGDDSRSMPPFFINGTSSYFMSINRGKESIVIDMKTPEGSELARKLVAKADIVVENNRPGILGRLGLGFDDLVKVNPDLVQVSISGFGQDGPYRDLPAYDMIVQAMSGGMSVTGENDGKPVRSGVPIGDMAAGIMGAFTAVSALHSARATGEAQHMDVSMLDVQVSMLGYQMAHFLATNEVPTLQGRGHSGSPEMGAYTCADGVEILIAPLGANMWPDVRDAMGFDDLKGNPDYDTRLKRREKRVELKARLEQTFLTRTSEEWIKHLRHHNVPVAGINSFDKVIEDPQVQHRGMVAETDFDGVPVRLIGAPFKLSGHQLEYEGPPTLSGNAQHILGEDLGLDEEAISRLKASGALG